MAVGTTRATMAEKAYIWLKHQIVSGELVAGQRLLPETLATALEISPTPVKEALRRLERDGLVETEARRGIMVRRFRRSEIVHLYQVRELIETHALRTAFEGDTRTLLEDLHHEQGALLAAIEHRSLQGLAGALAHDSTFHSLLVARTGNPLMIEWHAQIMTQTHTIRAYTPFSYTTELVRAEHGAIIAAIRAGDAQAARQAMIRHLDRSRDDVVRRSPGIDDFPETEAP